MSPDPGRKKLASVEVARISRSLAGRMCRKTSAPVEVSLGKNTEDDSIAIRLIEAGAVIQSPPS
jgi:hypothetical protein